MIQKIRFAPNLTLQRDITYDREFREWEVYDWDFVDDRGKRVEASEELLSLVEESANDVHAFGGLEAIRDEHDCYLEGLAEAREEERRAL